MWSKVLFLFVSLGVSASALDTVSSPLRLHAFHRFQLVGNLLHENDDQRIPSRSKRQVITGGHFPKNRWENGIVPYHFHSSISHSVAAKIREGFKFWEDNTCVRFQENGYGSTRLRFYRGHGCDSPVGKIYSLKDQDVSIGPGCEPFGVVTHEIAHALGFYHEQTRYDRDDYVTVNMDNIQKRWKGSFEKKTPGNTTNYGLPYDYGSNMQYSEDTFAINKDIPVITAKDPLHQHTMGQRAAPSFLDVLMMNKHYQCLGRCKTYNTVCYNQGYPNPNNCYKCICPWGFGGDRCDRRDSGRNNTVACGGELDATTEWKTLEATVGSYAVEVNRHDHCHWHIRAPQGRRILVRADELEAQCEHSCFWRNVEFKLQADLRLSGYRMCCNKHGQGQQLWSDTNLAIISAYARSVTYTIRISYRHN
ncbi:hypothetical protein QR680_004424 [Steinernema hermaphroditum]|uniref:Zinc metalloproteinase n=1 Tax=Steinernema hermaphroditum TaxID=289476 RepID=A0AA39LTP0_9BILA|nr:hypothetical protein QR680_004424 [Steinernema hermaphroditum]